MRSASSASRSRRSGFTIIELIVAMMIGTVLIGAIYQVLLTNQRVATVQREQVLGQQTVRAGIDLLAQEIREISAAGGDLVTLNASSVGFRALRAFGVACNVVNSVPPVLRVANEGRAFVVGDSVFVFADGNPLIAADDQWFMAAVTSVTNGLTCGTDAVNAQSLSLSAPGTQANSNLIQMGAIVRGWQGAQYSLATVGGIVYLVRQQGGETARLVGPLRGGDGVTFRYLTENGAATNVPANVARIEITLRSLSGLTDNGVQLVDSLTTSVNLRN